MRRSKAAAAVCAAVCAVSGACSFAPPLTIPEVPAGEAFKEAAPWTAAAPADALPRDRWWSMYGDTELDTLQGRLVDGSPDLAGALARYVQAQALSDQTRAGLFPTLAANGNVQRDRQSVLRPLRVLGPSSPDQYSSLTLGVQLDYEFDLWGRVRNQVAAGVASAQAAQADLESARLSLQAQLADSYIQLRGLDREAALLDDAVANYRKALELTTTRHDGGLASGLDVARAQTQLDSTKSQAEQSRAQRALVEHAIAALVGESATTFTIVPRLADIALPQVPAGVPSTLLQRRPDIAAAERRIEAANATTFTIVPRLADVALPQVPAGVPSTLLQRRPDIAAAERRIEAANATIGVARAAFYPAVTLSGLGGYQTSDIGSFISAPNAFWAIGPSLALSLFDAGRRRAEVERVRAVLDENSARYRGVVLGAFQQVEDNLALLNHYRTAADSERSALAAAQRALDFATLRYREGAVNYLEVVTAQTATLQSQRSALTLDTLQRRASVQLIRALGGGWVAPAQPVALGPLGRQ